MWTAIGSHEATHLTDYVLSRLGYHDHGLEAVARLDTIDATRRGR